MTYDERLNECLAAIKNGDQTKYAELHQLTYGPLINVAKSYLINKSDAAMVLSDVYLNIFLYADRYDTSKNAKPYLWQIVKRKAFSYNQQHLKHNTVNIDGLQIFDQVDLYERANTRIDVNKALKLVGHTNSMIIIWTYRDRLTQDEIGERLGITKSAVSQRLTKTKKKLREYLN